MIDKDNKNKEINEFLNKSYEYGFTTEIESETIPPGLDEDVVTLISKMKNEPEFLLKWRLKAFSHWKKMPQPDWAKLSIDPIDYQAISYFSKHKQDDGLKSVSYTHLRAHET